MTMTNPLADRACIVTGSTSGIGLAIALELATQGASVLLTGRSVAKGEAALCQLTDKGANAVFLAADIAQSDAGTTITKAALDNFGRIDVLVNNAGMISRGTALECRDADWDELLDVNLSAPFRLIRAVLPTMLAQQSGSIVNIASDWALKGARGAVAYATSKAALVQLTRCIALAIAVAASPTLTRNSARSAVTRRRSYLAKTTASSTPATTPRASSRSCGR